MVSWCLKTAPDGWLARQPERQAESQNQGLRQPHSELETSRHAHREPAGHDLLHPPTHLPCLNNPLKTRQQTCRALTVSSPLATISTISSTRPRTCHA